MSVADQPTTDAGPTSGASDAAKRGRCSASSPRAWISSPSEKGSPDRDKSASTVIAVVLRLALSTRDWGAEATKSGCRNTALARVLGSKSARRAPLSGSSIADPALTVAVVGVVGMTSWGSLGASSLGLTSRPLAGSRAVARLRPSRCSASRMEAARAVTTAEPPPKAITASALWAASSRATASTAGRGLWATTPLQTATQRPPAALRTERISTCSRASEAPQTTTARWLSSRSSSGPSCLRLSTPLKRRKAGTM